MAKRLDGMGKQNRNVGDGKAPLDFGRSANSGDSRRAVMPLDARIDTMISERHLVDKGEIAHAFDNLDGDVLDDSTRMSTIDFNARLDRQEIDACLVMDELLRLNILPKGISLARQKKRLSVSLDGRGRREKVELFASNNESKNGMSGLSKLFKPRA